MWDLKENDCGSLYCIEFAEKIFRTLFSLTLVIGCFWQKEPKEVESGIDSTNAFNYFA